MYKTYHKEEIDKKRKEFDLKNMQIVFRQRKNYSMDSINYKEINPYKRRSKSKKGNLKPKKARLSIIINIKY